MTSGDQQHGKGRALPAQRLDHDFSLMLAKVIENVQHDKAQFRNLIYEMARVQLQREAWHRNPPMNILELRRMMLALETAIERVETEAAQHDALPSLSPAALPATRDAAPHDPILLIDQAPRHLQASRPAARTAAVRRVSAPMMAIIRLGLLASVAAGLVIVLDREFHLLRAAPPATVDHVAAPPSTPPTPQPATAAPAVAPPPAPSGPLPSVYGVYALSGGRLYELDPLVGRPPDLRIFMSALIRTPSRTVLPDGDASFIVYRRDIASSAPDRVTVRAIAKVARSLRFSTTGQPVTINVDGEWAIRNVSIDCRVAPSSESPEMILVKPEGSAPPLPAGRYALVIKNQMFDFTVDGPIMQTSQCLERTEAANGTFYSECRQLP